MWGESLKKKFLFWVIVLGLLIHVLLIIGINIPYFIVKYTSQKKFQGFIIKFTFLM